MKLWRGDSDPTNIRQLQFSVKTGDGLYTTLINKGNPAALSQQPFVDSIQKHAHGGWNTSHFLSFTKNSSIADRFAIGRSGKTLHISTHASWDAIIAEVDLSKLKHVQNVGVGIDHYDFQELGQHQTLIVLAPMHQIGFDYARKNRRQAGMPTVRNILAIDVYSHLSHLAAAGHSISAAALATSQQEEEVLLLPIDPLWGSAGATAQLDFGCVSSIEYFHLV